VGVVAPPARRVFEPGRVFVVPVRCGFAGLASVLVVAGVIFGGASVASASAPCGSVAPTQSGSTVTCSYASGASDTFSVPAGVTSVTITAVGGHGGSTGPSPCPAGAGGEGAIVSATAVTVSPLDSLAVTVATNGGNGTTVSGECAAGGGGGSGAGSGGAGADGGGGGGGGSAVVDTTTPATLVVAGGGGGGGGQCTNCASQGGDAGQQGAGDAQSGGFPGTQSGPGNAGASLDGPNVPCEEADSGSGMNGGPDLVGGGGGGGYYGGGAGCRGAGGGGGSSYPATDVTGDDPTGMPSVTISYTVPPPPPPPSVAISTNQQPASATVGSPIADKATVSRGSSPTGTVTFKLYSNSTASGTPLFSDTEALSGAVATSAGYTATATGTDYWAATYNGDTNNGSVSSDPAAEPVTITAATPSISTTQQPASATIGSSIGDRATVSGGYNPTGTVTFNLYSNSNGTGLLFTDANVPLSSGTATSTGYTASAAGTYYWVATYNGDTNNNSVSSATGGEQVSITKATTSLRAAPQLVLFEPFVGVGNRIVQATLTSAGKPAAGQTIYFTDGPVQLCHATTNANGVARCSISSLDQALVNRNNQYSATYTATTNYLGSTSTVPAITFFW
jgi:hypothetical protein